jgi:hypothetical protein
MSSFGGLKRTPPKTVKGNAPNPNVPTTNPTNLPQGAAAGTPTSSGVANNPESDPKTTQDQTSSSLPGQPIDPQKKGLKLSSQIGPIVTGDRSL